LLYTYAANAKALTGRVNEFIGVVFGDWIIHVWGLCVAFGGLAPMPLVLAHDLVTMQCGKNLEGERRYVLAKSGKLSEKAMFH